jgi:hypothetical protein
VVRSWDDAVPAHGGERLLEHGKRVDVLVEPEAPRLGRVGYTWPLASAAALVIITLAVPVSVPGVRGLRLRHAATAARQVDVLA